MKQIITYKFEESDFELLKKGFPDTPCDECNGVQQDSCFCCKDYEIYKSEANKYKQYLKEANLYEYGKALAKIKKLNKEKKRIQNELSELWKSLPDEIKARKDIKEMV